MMNKITTNPILSAAFCFILIWAVYPAAALLFSYMTCTTFAAAASMPYIIAVFIMVSIISAQRMYHRTKNSAMQSR